MPRPHMEPAPLFGDLVWLVLVQADGIQARERSAETADVPWRRRPRTCRTNILFFGIRLAGALRAWA